MFIKLFNRKKDPQPIGNLKPHLKVRFQDAVRPMVYPNVGKYPEKR
jgi:hypothetical protein